MHVFYKINVLSIYSYASKLYPLCLYYIVTYTTDMIIKIVHCNTCCLCYNIYIYIYIYMILVLKPVVAVINTLSASHLHNFFLRIQPITRSYQPSSDPTITTKLPQITILAHPYITPTQHPMGNAPTTIHSQEQ